MKLNFLLEIFIFNYLFSRLPRRSNEVETSSPVHVQKPAVSFVDEINQMLKDSGL